MNCFLQNALLKIILPQQKTSAVSTAWLTDCGAGQKSGIMVFYWHKGSRKEEGRRPLRCSLSQDVLGELTECGALASTGKQTVQQTGWDCHRNGCKGNG